MEQEARPLDWLSPIPPDPPETDDQRVVQEAREQEKDRIAAELYSRFATASMDFITQFLDWSWFRADWRGTPRWKWIVRGYVGLLAIGPAIALCGFLILGWYR